MNQRIRELAEQASKEAFPVGSMAWMEVFAKLLVKKTLDEVAERAYYSGDRAWSDELDRPWIELEFGFGELAK
jgi:hypothetical protein